MKTKSSNFVPSASCTIEDLGNGVKRSIMSYDGQIMMVKVDFEEGAIGYVHQHYHSQCSYVAGGKFEVEIKSEKQILATGDAFYCEPDAPHGVQCLEAGTLIDIFSPMRQDFLK